MFTRPQDFRKAWAEEVQDTLKVLEAIPDQALGQSVAPGFRDLRRTAWHLVESIGGMASEMGLRVAGPTWHEDGTDGEAVPGHMSRIAAQYGRSADALLEALAGWDEAELQKEDTLFGHLRWKRGETLLALVMHQAHHRGQMTVLMRQAGLKVPEFYGPTKEAWATLGQPEPAV